MGVLQKDKATMQAAINNPSELLKACDAQMSSAKMGRFLEKKP